MFDSLIVSIVRFDTGGFEMEIVYGYCRCSKKKQLITRQVSNILKEYPNAIIYKEFFTGTTNERKQWKKLKSIVKAGDTIVFDSVSRMSRQASSGFKDYKELYLRHINLVFLNEPFINTSVFRKASENMINIKINSGNIAIDEYFEGNINLVNKLLLDLAEQQIEIAFLQSEKEVSDLHKRISDGLREAVGRGKQLGLKKGTKLTTKKSIVIKKTIREKHKEFGGDIAKDDELIKIIGCSRNTYFKYKREVKEELNQC